MTHETDEYTVTYNDDPDTQKLAFDTLLAWFKENEMFTGECIHQSDATYVEAPELLTKLAEEVFGFKTTWKE